VDQSKRGVKKRTIDGEIFDSQIEANYYEYLLSLQKQKIVKEIIPHPKFLLQEKFIKNNKTYLPIYYIADFQVTYTDGKIIIVDIKGMVTPEFRLKRKLFDYKYPELELQCLNFSKIDGGWITIEDLDKARKERKKEKNKLIK
jgi:hypothetical protein